MMSALINLSSAIPRPNSGCRDCRVGFLTSQRPR